MYNLDWLLDKKEVHGAQNQRKIRLLELSNNIPA